MQVEAALQQPELDNVNTMTVTEFFPYIYFVMLSLTLDHVVLVVLSLLLI